MSVDVVAQAKRDLERAGQTFRTICDAYKITNLAAKRMGWKVLEKKTGDNCEQRAVDIVIVGGRIIDCLRSAGPPANLNEPTWQDQGPQTASQVAKDPFDWPDPIEPEQPPQTDLGSRVTLLEDQMSDLQVRVAQLERFAGGVAGGAFTIEDIAIRLKPIE